MLYSRANWVRSVLSGAALLALVIPAAAQRDPLFKTEILPVLEKNCVGCHNPQQKMARLDLSSFTGMMEGSSSGPVLAPGKPERSLMWKLIENDTMPQGGKLTTAEKQLIKALPKMAKNAESQPLSDAFTNHLEETKNHVARLEQIFESLGETPKGKKCVGMEGIRSLARKSALY